jgi:mono/diheme cytochrome c family protein
MRRMLALSLICILACACTRPREGRERRDFERMRQQQRYDSYQASAFFHNGAVMQPPPAHTVARATGEPWSGRVESPAFLTGVQGATDVADLPIAIDSAARAAGAEQFAISCVPCHGAGGYGGGVMAANLRDKRPPSLRAAPVSSLPAGTIFKIVTNGFGRMPPYGWQMPPAMRWAVGAYVQSLPYTSPTAATHSDSVFAAYLRALDSARTLAGRMSLPAPSADFRR